ncbi:MAG: phosphatase PAP2 family protein [Wenzhouxiangella sp.]
MPQHSARSSRLVFVVSLVLFVIIAALVVTGHAAGFDRAGLLALQNVAEEVHPRGPVWMREAARDLTALGSVSVLGLATLLGVIWLWAAGRLVQACLLAVWMISGSVASFLLKALFSQPRPDLVTMAPQVFTSSFPSSHAMMSALTFLLLAMALGAVVRQRPEARALMTGAVLLTVISGISRIYLGVHWPSDVLAGWSMGVAWVALACWLAPGTFLRR